MTVSPALLSVVAFVALNSILFAFYLGKLSSRVDQNKADIAALKDVTNEQQRVLEAGVREGIRADVRMAELEKLNAKVDGLRDEVVSSRAAADTERRTMKEHSQKMEREVGGIHRQLANIASGQTGLLQIKTPGA